MSTVGYLKVSVITDSDIKKIAEASNTETKNDTIDTKSEWHSFLSGIANAFGAGKITYDVAKKYVNQSSSIFTQSDKLNNAYKRGFIEEMDFSHDLCGSRIERKIQNLLNPGAISYNIINRAENSELEEHCRILYEQIDNMLK